VCACHDVRVPGRSVLGIFCDKTPRKGEPRFAHIYLPHFIPFGAPAHTGSRPPSTAHGPPAPSGRHTRVRAGRRGRWARAFGPLPEAEADGLPHLLGTAGAAFATGGGDGAEWPPSPPAAAVVGWVAAAACVGAVLGAWAAARRWRRGAPGAAVGQSLHGVG
jgi:hypothetical protein